MRDAVKTAGEIDYRPSIAITRKGTSHNDQQVGASRKIERRNNAKRMYLCYMRVKVYSRSQRCAVLLGEVPI